MHRTPPDLERIEVSSRDELFAWLERHHARERGVLLVTFKRHVDGKYVTREDILDAVVAHGWTDGRRWAVDEDRTMQLIAPRKTRIWARTYKRRADRLIREGAMHASGLRALRDAQASGLWEASDPVDDLLIPSDLSSALQCRGQALAFFMRTAVSYRRNVLRWIHAAKTQATREKRIDALASACANEEKLPHY